MPRVLPIRCRPWHWLLWAGLLLAGAAAQAAEVRGVRLWAEPDGTRVVLDLSAPTRHNLFTLDNPFRVVVDLDASHLASHVRLPTGDGVVRGLRSARQSDGRLRVVLDLSEQAQPRSFSLAPNDVYGHRLVIDLAPADARREPVRARQETDPRGRELVVAIDAGHGGEDPGAIGRQGTREKDVVLAISLELARRIDAEPGMRAVLTRQGDYFVSLRDRMERARAAQADLFISIHADAVVNTTARGATVYVLSQSGASDEAARRLAERENAADLIGGVSLADKDDMLASVLLDLSQNAALSASYIVGQHVIDQMGLVTRMRRTQVQRAPFVVLKSPDVPSLLIETAYISNPEEERGLSDRTHQQRLAESILRGVRSYFHENPPPDSYIARMRREGLSEPARYVVARGDTLSGIALRYNVTVQALRARNGINGDRIQVGQELTIPAAGANGR